jgi:hypothetical protein
LIIREPGHDVGVEEITEPFSAKKGKTMYAWNVYDPTYVTPDGPNFFDSATPGVVTNIDPNSAQVPFAGDWAEGLWYVLDYEYYSPTAGHLLTVDPTNGAITDIGDSGIDTYYEIIEGLAYDPATQKMYACTVDTDYYSPYYYHGLLYEIDMSNGAATLVGSMGYYYIMMGIAFDNAGNLYGIELMDNHLYEINPLTADVTQIGYLGFDLGYAQDIAYDREDDIMYWAAYWGKKDDIKNLIRAAPYSAVSSKGSGLYTIDVSNANTNFIGNFQGNLEQCALAIPYELGPPECYPPDVYPVEVKVKNHGIFTETFPVRTTIKHENSGTIVYNEVETVTGLAAGAETTVLFPNWDATPGNLIGDGDFTVRSCTELPGDENTGNDCKSKRETICVCLLCADAGGPYQTDDTMNFGVTFNGLDTLDMSYCPEPGVLIFDWNLGDGTILLDAGPVVYHEYTDPCPDTLFDTYTVTLTVSCTGIPNPCSDTDTTTVKVFGPCAGDPPIVQMIYPGGGETLSGVETIQWFALDDHDPTLDIFIYLGNGGGTWTKLFGPIANDGAEDWNTATVSDGTYQLKVEAYNHLDRLNFDTSGDFTVSNGYTGARVSAIEITDTTTGSKQWVKNGDTVEINAMITGGENLDRTDIVADLSGFGMAHVHADSFDGLTAQWTLNSVICPSEGPITVTVRAENDRNTATITADNTIPELSIVKPEKEGLYVFGMRLLPLRKTVIIGKMTIDIAPKDNYGISKAEYYIDGTLKDTITEQPFDWNMNLKLSGEHTLKIIIYDHAGNYKSESKTATIYNFFGN